MIGVASHLVWDALTVSPFLQNGSTVVGLVAISWYLWHRRHRLRTEDGPVPRLGAAARWSVVAALIAIPVLGIAVQARDDYNALATASEVDYSHPVTVDRGNGVTETSYPTTTVPAPWYTVVEGMATGAVKRAGASFVVVLLLYVIGRNVIRRTRR